MFIRGRSRYVKGTHNSLSDDSGQKYKRKDMRLTWDNKLVGADEWDEKHPQLTIRPRPDSPAITNQTRVGDRDQQLAVPAYILGATLDAEIQVSVEDPGDFDIQDQAIVYIGGVPAQLQGEFTLTIAAQTAGTIGVRALIDGVVIPGSQDTILPVSPPAQRVAVLVIDYTIQPGESFSYEVADLDTTIQWVPVNFSG